MQSSATRLAAAAVGALALLAATAGTASGANAYGQLLRLAPHAHANANRSTNWFGYNQGTLEKGNTLFSSITGDWIVPTATQHTRGQDEYSSDWIGIGGGCVDAGCTVGDSTLIQTGTEQDFSAAGAASYGGWWEVIPGPSLAITNMTVRAGDHMHASISELAAGSNVWTITLQNATRGQTYTTTVPYSSTHATAEWIEETPLLLGANAGFAALPNLTNPAFTAATTNGGPANLVPAEEMFLTDQSGNVIGAPSAPNATGDGFSACAWATTC
jgi:hypothetical protein